MATDVQFARMNGIGNKIIVADMRGRADHIQPAAAIAINATPGMDFDQLMVIHDAVTPGTDAYVMILNSDGSEAGACGNGMRCVTQALAAETGKTGFLFQVGDGLVAATELPDGQLRVDMGVPKTDWQAIPLAEEFRDTRMIELEVGPRGAPVLHSPAALNMGNPHITFFVEDDVWSYDLARFGPLLEHHPLFPDRVNVTIARLVGPDHFEMRTWERGAGLTLACGSAACAVAVNAHRKRLASRNVRLTLPGGELMIEWREDGHVLMTGPAQWEFSGHLDAQSGAVVRDAGDGAEQAG